eukprot:g1384.t1
MKSLVLVLSIVLCVNGKKAFRHGSKVELEAQKKLEAFHAMIKSSPPEHTLGGSTCPGQPSYCKKYSQSETPFEITLKAQTLAFGTAMRNAFGDDIGNIWELYLKRRYMKDKWTGAKVRLVEDIDPSMTRTKHRVDPNSLMTDNIKRQFQGDPETLSSFGVALQDATDRLSMWVACHASEFSVLDTLGKEESELPWFSAPFAPLLEESTISIHGKPPGYVDINYGGTPCEDTMGCECEDTLYHAPSNLAGGVGGSDYGDDLRHFSGHLHCQAMMKEKENYVKVKCLSKVELEIFDAIDFCPGGCGTVREQILTVPFSRREASGLAYDVPLHLKVWMPTKYSEAEVAITSPENCGALFTKTTLSMSDFHLNFPNDAVVDIAHRHDEHIKARKAVKDQCKAPIYSAGPLLKTISKLI